MGTDTPAWSQIDRSAPRGSSSSPVSGPNTIVERRTGSYGSHAPTSSHDGSSPRAKATHACCIASDKVDTRGPLPVKTWIAGLSTVPKAKGISSPWHDPNAPPMNGDSHVKRYE